MDNILVLYSFIFITPLALLAYNRIRVLNYSYLLKIFFFNILVIIYNIFYLFVYLFFFIFKNLRFFELYFSYELGFNNRLKLLFKKNLFIFYFEDIFFYIY